MDALMKRLLPLTCCLVTLGCHARASDNDKDITWLVNYDGKALPEAPWKAEGKVNAKIEDGALHVIDDSKDMGDYRMNWKAETGQEIIVEAKAKVGEMTGAMKGKKATSVWPWRDGAPIAVQVSDGLHQDGLVLFPAQATSFTDRFIPLNTTDAFHTYRLVIHGTDMSMWVDGVQKVQGQNAFWKKAESTEPFIQFGSSAK
ncbi:MAG: hypothetical protein JWO08_1459, partial [Verrucomicrobiaceae bacterium]|nr:hypothetical protein [Verrucomicrobiaceae bacterium]